MILSNIKDFFLILKMQNRQAWYHKKAALGMILSWGTRIGLTIALYKGIYELTGQQSIHSVSLAIAISSMFIYAIFSGFGSRDLFFIINKEYRSGAMEIWLNKPISYLVLKAGETFGKNIPIASGLITCAVIYWAINGLPDTDHIITRLSVGLLLLALGLVIVNLLYMIVGLSVIWVEDAAPVYQIVDKTLMVFGGIYVPISFFPPAFRLMGESLPTGAVLFCSQIFYADFFQNLPRFLVTQFIWIILLGIAIRQTNKAAQTRLTVNGG